MNLRITLLLLSGILWFNKAWAQKNLVRINPVTGSANAYIPLLSGNIQVGLSYSSNGVRLKDSEGDAGLGWNLNAGGQVTRVLRGLPDDITTSDRRGWMENNNGTSIENFIIANNSSPVNCTNAQSDLNYINSNFSYLNDTEPDIFNINAPGLSCTFVFDKDHVIRTIPYQDLKITYTKAGIPSQISSFTVINNKGTKYVFSERTIASKYTTRHIGFGMPYLSEANLKYYRSQYEQFKSKTEYNNAWMLSSIEDATGNKVIFNYEYKGTTTINKKVEFNIGGVGMQPLYILKETFQNRVLSSIQSLGATVSFSYGVYNSNAAEGALVSTITANGVKYVFNYSNLIFKKGQTSFKKNCLRNITTDQCESPINYFFEYDGESSIEGTSQYDNRDSAYQYTDIWGYYTGIKSNSIAAVNSTNVTVGMLKSIKYYDNGSTTLEYESNNFYNPTLGSVVSGGGVRVKKITDYDGISIGNNIIRNYDYRNPVTSITSGIPLSLPQTTFLRPVASIANTTNSTVSADNDLSEEDHTVMYSYVKESQAGKGSTLYEYKVPAGAFDTTTPMGDWVPTATHVGVQGCSQSLGMLANSSRTYPFAVSTNYDFERGLPSKETAYNDAGVKVAEVTYTYQRSFNPIVINALKFDEADYARVYSKYSIYTTTSELNTQVERVIFDPSSNTVGQRTINKFTYGSSAHKEVTQQEIDNSDGAVTRINTVYSKDYIAGTASTYSTALTNKNINVPLESYTSVKQAGTGVFKVVGGQFTKYATFPAAPPLPDNVLPSASYQFTSVTGLTNFIPTLTTNAGTPDSRYILANTFTKYETYGALKSSVGINKQPQTIISNATHHLPLATFSNANPSEIAYGVEGGDDGFVMSEYWSPVVGRSGMITARTFTSNCTLSKTITKRSVVKTYVFSTWIKSSSNGSFNITAGTQTFSLAYQANSNWTYYEVNIPVGNLSNTFTVSFTLGGGISVDDVLLYPQIATASTFGYNEDRYKIIETNTNGRSTYYDIDKLGRINVVYDQDKQIIQRKTYNYDEQGILPDALFYVDLPVGDKNIYANTSYTFRPYNSFSSCAFTGAEYSWNYGDGSPSTTMDHHTFTSAGTYNVTLTVTVPGVGTKISTIPIIVKPTPPAPVYLYYAVDPLTQNDLQRVEFIQGGQTIQIVYPNEFPYSMIPPGATTVRVYLSGSNYDRSVVLQVDGIQTICKNAPQPHPLSFSINPTNEVFLMINSYRCE